MKQIPVFTIARYGFIEALQGRILFISLALTVLAFIIALFVGEISLTETRQTQLAFMSGFLRFASVVTIIFFVVASVARDFQDKSVELLFSVSMPRYQVFIGKWLGYCMVVFAMAVMFALLLFFYADATAVLAWSLSLFLELSVVSLIALVFILSLENVAISLAATFGLYVLTRIMPVIQGIGEGQIKHGAFSGVLNSVMDFIDLLLPKLSDFTQASWLMYGRVSASEVIVVIIESMLFIFLFSLLGILDIKRKSI